MPVSRFDQLDQKGNSGILQQFKFTDCIRIDDGLG
ncbi:hypothetical protein RSAG8_10918, partial [Rhizoctonia solani AG-8 WAC10335]